MTSAFNAYEDPDLDRVWAWFEYQKALITESRRKVLGQLGPDISLSGHELRFLGQTTIEVAEFFEEQRAQLELLTMFELLATAEAGLRIDVRTRVKQRRKDSLSRRFRELYKSNEERLRLDEDILTAFVENGAAAKSISDFRAALKLRHWLAHGRHWHPKLGRGYTPGDILDISRALLEEVAALP